MIPSHFRLTPPEGYPRASNDASEGLPILLGAFPKQVAVAIPATGEVVGRGWLEAAGITDGKVSREHLSFSRIDRRVLVTDKHSHNGTFINGIEIEPDMPTALDDGAILRIGQTIFVFREAFTGALQPERPLGDVVGPWGLETIRKSLYARTYRPGLNILIDGPVGTEKASLAREIATRLRPGTKLVEVNLAAIDRDSFEKEMFGWENQRFTGSFRAYPGSLRSAAGGTIFLDEIDSVPIDSQLKLLKFLDRRDAQPIGAREPFPTVDCLVIATTSRTVAELVANELLSRDVAAQFRLRFSLPPLEKRPEDLFAMLAARWNELHGKLDLGTTRVDAETIDRLMRHHWPENVRELQRFVDSLDRDVGIKRGAADRLVGSEPAIGHSGVDSNTHRTP